ncbi:MAG: ATP-binding protein, partial [Pseudomonadota bacterium]|nr:ATP-binding protein [Pseudomonadota bacterium]
MRLKSQESGAGRFTDFMLPPLTFSEYLQFVDRDTDLIEPDPGSARGFRATSAEAMTAINQEFINYLNFG